MTQDFNPRYHLDSEQDHHLQGEAPAQPDDTEAKVAAAIVIIGMVMAAIFWGALWSAGTAIVTDKAKCDAAGGTIHQYGPDQLCDGGEGRGFLVFR